MGTATYVDSKYDIHMVEMIGIRISLWLAPKQLATH